MNPSDNSNSAIVGYHKSKVALKVVGILVFAITTFLLCLFVSTSIAEGKTAGFTISVSKKSPIGTNYCSISLCEHEAFEEPTTSLFPEGVEEITNISGSTLRDVDNQDGSHNGGSYIAYTFYVKNSGNADGYINESMNVVSDFGGVKDSIRVRIYRDGVSETYATLSKDGSPEYGTTPFLDENKITDCDHFFEVNQIKKYTIVIWLEGDDPECDESIKGSEIRFDLSFKVTDGSGSPEETPAE